MALSPAVAGSNGTIVLLAFGTRGDVQPTVALGLGLHDKGYRVRVLASSNFTRWIEDHGLEAAPSQVDIQAMMRSAAGQDWVEQSSDPRRQLKLMQKLIDRHGAQMAEDVSTATRDAAVIISSFTSDTIATAAAEKLGIPQISVPLQPALFATRDGRALVNAPFPARLSIINYLFGKLLIEPYPWQAWGAVTRALRRRLGLPPQTARENRALRRGLLTLQAISRHVVPQPDDWPPNFHTVGFFFLDEGGWTPPDDLLAFLDAGPPPVYLGFGSMTGSDPAGLTRLLLDAVQESGQRALLLSGWAGLGELPLPPDVFALDHAPHHWLFPRMAAVVHHGGAGTTAAGLRAGVPTVVVPHMADQPFWGRRVAALGAGPAPIPRPKLQADILAAAIREATTSREMRQSAADLGRKIRAENGVASAVALIQRHLQAR